MSIESSIHISDVKVGDVVTPITMQLSVQKLVMITAANRDFAPMHHDPEIARSTGAPTAYTNMMFVMAMLERTATSWAGLGSRMRKIGPLRMSSFNRADDTITCSGTVTDVDLQSRIISLEMWIDAEADRRNVSAVARIELPH